MLRVDAARVMMEESRYPIDVVAQETGLAHRDRMRRAFLRAFGQPPQDPSQYPFGSDRLTDGQFIALTRPVEAVDGFRGELGVRGLLDCAHKLPRPYEGRGSLSQCALLWSCHRRRIGRGRRAFMCRIEHEQAENDCRCDGQERVERAVTVAPHRARVAWCGHLFLSLIDLRI